MLKVKFLLRYISKHKVSYGFGVLFIIATNWIAVSIPKYIELSIDLIKEPSFDIETLKGYIWVMAILAALTIVVRSASRVLFFNPGRAIECQIKNEMFDTLVHLPKKFYDKNPTGGIISKITNDVGNLRLLFGFGLMQIFNILTALTFSPIKMYQISPKLTLYCIIPIIFVFTIVRFGMKLLVHHMRMRMEKLQNVSSFSIAALSGINEIKGYNIKDWTESQFVIHNNALHYHSIKLSMMRSFVMPLLGHLENFLKVLILGYGGYLVIESSLSIGQLSAFITYSTLLTMPLLGLGWVSTLFQQAMVGLESINSILDNKVNVPLKDNLPVQKRKSLFDKGLQIKGLSYRFEDGETDVLKNISLEIKPNQIIGVLGKIGSGKSTLVNLMTGYLKSESNKIFLGDRDINSLSLHDLRASIRLVTQSPFLFSDSVKNNITFALDDEQTKNLDLAKIIDNSGLTDEIKRFTDKEETLVGEKGIMLSGGQKQRISLARVFCEPCDLLVLDDVFSAVDYETENYLFEKIKSENFAKSVLVISQRITTLKETDQIIVLNDGKIEDIGTHEALLKKDGLYLKTWKIQS